MSAEGAVGPLETAVRADVDGLGDLTGVQPSLAELAYRLARVLDAGARGMSAAAIARELRETLDSLTKQSDADGEIKKLLEQMATPITEGGE